MNIQLISQDKELYKSCREILGEFSWREWQLLVSTPDSRRDANIDLHIWDFQEDFVLPSEIRDELSKHLFLVHRNDLVRFRETLGRPEANILLKPATRATLSTFLGLAASAHEASTSTVNQLRADRDEVLQCLIQTNLRLQEYDQDRTNFLARAVHDFRAPLTAVTGYSGLLLSEALGPLNADQKEVLRRMQHSAKRLSRMASAMFQLSIGRHVKRRPDLCDGDLAECVQQALHEIGPGAAAKRIAVTADLDPKAGVLLLEPGLIEQVLVNLLDNASKFTPKSGAIAIRGYPFFWERRQLRHSNFHTGERRGHVSRKPNAYRVDILDSGPPIPAEGLEKIFEEYTSYAGANDRSGGGLGLAICRMIIEQHEGIVWAENTDDGPTFSFILPMTPHAGANNNVSLDESLQLSEVRT